ncbi:MAG: chain-length determining protein [Desulfuromonadales bacterium]|nr:MAG: chain-length determining protein [Desulfuromonadales bacterium]
MEAEIKSFGDIVRIVKRRKLSLIVPAVAIFTVALVAAVALPRMYRSTSTILIEEQEIPRDFVMTTVTSYAEERLQTINQRIMSSTKLLEIINRFNLYADLRKSKTTEEIIALMRRDIKFQTISADVVDRRTGRPTAATIAFSLAYEGQSPAMVQQVSNVLASLYLEENLKVREQQTLGATRFMEEEMKDVQAQLVEIERKIADYKQRNVSALPELAQLNMQTLDRTDRDVDQLHDQLRMLREKEGYLEVQLSSIPTDDANTDKGRLRELRVKLVDLKTRLSDAHPDVIKARSEIAALESQLKGSGRDMESKPDNPAYVTLSAQLASTRAEIDSIKRQVQLAQGKRESYRRRLEAFPQVEEGYKVMLVERNNLQLKYDDLSKKFMEAKVAHGLEKEQMGERFTLIDAARLPEKPVSPNVPAILIIGLILGLGAGVGTAAFREYGDQAAHGIETLARATALPVLAAIPEIVTWEETAALKRRRRMVAAGTAMVVIVAIPLIHFFVMDLDILVAKLMRRLSV